MQTKCYSNECGSQYHVVHGYGFHAKYWLYILKLSIVFNIYNWGLDTDPIDFYQLLIVALSQKKCK